MKFEDMVIKDDGLGITVTVTAEIIDWEDNKFPDVTINDISYRGKSLTLWAFSESYTMCLKNKIFQMWCAQGQTYA